MQRYQTLLIVCLDQARRPFSKMNDSSRRRFLVGCFLTIEFLLMYGAIFEYRIILTHSLVSFLLVLTTAASVKGELHHVPWSRWITVPWTLLALSVAASCFLFPKTQILLALAFAILFPAFWFVWSNRGDLEELVRVMDTAALISFSLLVIYCFWGFPILDELYTGPSTNSNTMHFLLLAHLPFLLLAYTRCQMRLGRCGLMLLFGLYGGFSFYAFSRTATITGILLVAVWIVVQAAHADGMKKGMRIAVKCAAVVFIPMLLGVPFVFLFAGTLSHATSLADRNLTHILQPLGLRFGPQLVETNAVIDVVADGVDGHLPVPDVLNGLNELLTGRVNLWVNYLAQVGLVGHDPDDAFRMSFGPLAYNAHNGAIQTAYDYGVLAGCAFLFLQIAFPVRAFLYVRDRLRERVRSSLALAAQAPIAIQRLALPSPAPSSRPSPSSTDVSLHDLAFVLPLMMAVVYLCVFAIEGGCDPLRYLLALNCYLLFWPTLKPSCSFGGARRR